MTVINGSAQDVLTGLLVCPACNSDLAVSKTEYQCQGCGNEYAISGDTPCFAEPEMAEPEIDESDTPAGVAFRKRYEWQYQEQEDARQYDQSFRDGPRKRQRTKRELGILRSMLNSQPRCHTILDVPCGGGRLSPPIAARTEHLLEADIAPAQLQLALRHELEPQRGLIISALALPFDSGSLDAAVCARLSHHLPDPAEREQLLSELLRVSRSFVIFSFTDRKSIQSFGRKLRGKKLNPSAMSTDQIEQIALANGAIVDRFMTVSSIGPRHRFALLVKR